MGTRGKHRARKPTVWRRPAMLATAGVASTALATIAAYVAVSHAADVRAAITSRPGATQTPGGATKAANLAIATGPRPTFGPVRMEPGPAGSANATPRGTFTVMWKGGPNVVSNIYNEPMPWAVQFTSGGVAFHAGSLALPSHGCVHLTMANAHYYNEHLAIGAEVVVF
jgi:lipoprotein-anchoring transpeptidase ErfK/SrfK